MTGRPIIRCECLNWGSTQTRLLHKTELGWVSARKLTRLDSAKAQSPLSFSVKHRTRPSEWFKARAPLLSFPLELQYPPFNPCFIPSHTPFTKCLRRTKALVALLFPSSSPTHQSFNRIFTPFSFRDFDQSILLARGLYLSTHSFSVRKSSLLGRPSVITTNNSRLIKKKSPRYLASF